MKGSASKIQLAGFDDLFQTGGKAEANGEQVQEVPLAELFPFKVSAINDALAEMAEDGTLTELSMKYFGTDISKDQ